MDSIWVCHVDVESHPTDSHKTSPTKVIGWVMFRDRKCSSLTPLASKLITTYYKVIWIKKLRVCLLLHVGPQPTYYLSKSDINQSVCITASFCFTRSNLNQLYAPSVCQHVSYSIHSATNYQLAWLICRDTFFFNTRKSIQYIWLCNLYFI